jgi:serine/threonine protein kinase
VNDTSGDKTKTRHTRELIESAQQEAAKLAGGTPVVPPPPEAVPGFEIVGEVGRGGMGVVYKAKQLSTKRVVALKIMLGGWFASHAARSRFQREIELAARCRHPSIVHVLESGFTPTGQPYYAMDYVDGCHLDRWLRIHQPDLCSTLKLFVEICDAVAHAHDHDIVHRDLKPANVLIDAEGRPHILDFGLSKATDEAKADGSQWTTVSTPGQVMGTPRYLSPEQAAGTPAEIDFRTDVYALGVVLYESLTGAAPVDTSGSHGTATNRILSDSPVPPSTLCKHVDRELETIILKALEKEKYQRYQSVREFGGDIRSYLAGEPIIAQPPSSLYRLRKKLLKHRTRILYVAAVLAVGVLAAGGSSHWRARTLAREERQAEKQAEEQTRIDVLEALRLLDLRRFVSALEKANECFGRHPNLPDAFLVSFKARFIEAQRNRDESMLDSVMAPLRRQCNDPSAPSSYRALLAELESMLGNPDIAQSAATTPVADPDSSEAWYLHSLASFDRDWSLHCATVATELDPGNELAWHRLANLHLLLCNYDEALKAADELMRLGRDETKWTLFQCRVHVLRGQFDKAIALCTRLIDRLPNYHVVHRARGVAYLCEGKYAEAVEAYSRAVDVGGPEVFWTHYARATALWIVGRRKEAAADYKLVRESRSFADARRYLVLSELAQQLSEEGQEGAAAEVRAEASVVLEYACRNAIAGSAQHKYLNCLAGRIEPEELIGLADPADTKEVCESHYYAGEALMLAGRMEEARRCFEICVSTNLLIDPESPTMDAMNEYHLARWRLGQLSAQSAGLPGEPN